MRIREKNRHAREVSKAKRLGREMFHDENCGHFVDPGSSHCLRENQRKRQKQSQNQNSNRRRLAVLPLPLKGIVVILPLRHFPCQITQLQMHNVEVSFTPHPRVVEGISVASTAQYGDSFFHTTPSREQWRALCNINRTIWQQFHSQCTLEQWRVLYSIKCTIWRQFLSLQYSSCTISSKFRFVRLSL